MAKKIGVKEHTVRNALDYLSVRLNMKPYCFSDPFKQGRIPYRIYFCTRSGNSARINEMLKYLTELPETVWVFSLSGYYHYGLSLRTKGLKDLDTFLEKFDARFGDLIEKRTIGLIARFAYFIPWLAFSGRGSRHSFEYTLDEMSTQCDETDSKIIDKVRKVPNAPISVLARELSIRPSTMQYRLQKLIDNQVLLAFSYTYDYRVVGTESYLLLIALYGLGGNAHENIIEFCRQHPRGMWASKIIGEWNIELEVTLEDPQELHSIIQQIYEVGKGAVREINTHVWGKEFKV